MKHLRHSWTLFLSCTPLILLAGAASGTAQGLQLSLQERSLDVGDATIHYRIGGSGPPLLLIHGFALGGVFWDPYLDAFGASYTVIVPDLPAHGRSTRSPGEWSYKQVARDMFSLLDHLGFEQTSGIGHSAGGNTLLHMAVQQPHRIRSMVLVAGAHRLTVGTREWLRAFPPFEDQSPDVQEELLRIHPGGEQQVRALYALLRSLADNYEDFDFSPEHLATISVRTLLVWGDRDTAYPLDVALELYEALPSASLWVLPGEGHLFLASSAFGGSDVASGAFAPTVLRFLSGATE